MLARRLGPLCAAHMGVRAARDGGAVDEARTSIAAFIARENQECLIERLDHRTPAVAEKGFSRWPDLGRGPV